MQEAFDPRGAITWQPSLSVVTASAVAALPMALPVALATDVWQLSALASPRPQVISPLLRGAQTGAVTLSLVAPKLKVSSFQFPQFDSWKSNLSAPAPPAAPAVNPAGAAPPDPATKARTRIKPPGDVIKLEDRLLYLLQPSLETLIGDAALAMPFRPFAYQFEGVAFLYPRWTAILADEMGLGKTMQAITAMRLLLHAGELRSVLLVCPKPLVTNWQREFSLWAPELPITVIEGDQGRRRWQW